MFQKRILKVIVCGFILASTSINSTLAAPPTACNPQVKSALLEASRTGAERATGIINNPSSGIGLPKSVFELGCLDDLYNMRNINILFNPNTIIDGFINQAKQRICNIAKDVYTKTVSKPFNEAVFNAPIPTVPGLQTSFPNSQKSELPKVTIIPPENPIESQPNNNGFDMFKNFF